MKLRTHLLVAIVLVMAMLARAQETPISSTFVVTVEVPTTVGVDTGQTLAIDVRIYDSQTSSTAIWTEHFDAVLDSQRNVHLVIGSRTAGGVPPDLFKENLVRWMSLQFVGGSEQPRSALLAVPYAVKAANSDSLGGLPASAYQRASGTSCGKVPIDIMGAVPNEASTTTCTASTIKSPDKSITIYTTTDETLLSVTENAITSAKLADASVTSTKVGDSAITQSKIATDAVTTPKLMSGAVTSSKIADAAITSSKLADSAVTSAQLADAAVSTSKIADGAVASPKLADNSVTTPKVVDGSITLAKLAPGIVLGSSATVLQSISAAVPDGAAISSANTAPSGVAYGLYASTQSPSGSALKAESTATTGYAVAVRAKTTAPTGVAVVADAASATDPNFGVYATARGPSGTGVYGAATSASGTSFGVYGVTSGANNGAGVFGSATLATSSTPQFGVYGTAQGNNGIGVAGVATNTLTNAAPIGVLGQVASQSGTAARFVNTAPNANVLVAANATQNVLRVDSAGNIFMAGSVHTGGADFAEMMDSTDTMRAYEPGDVLVIGTRDRSVELSREPYSTRVLGVFATKPGVVGDRASMNGPVAGQVPVAMVGIVPAKVSAENGAIERGDLLVTSSTPGHLMKATDRQRMTGAIAGKALQSLASGTGVIEIAVTLQ